MARSSKRWRRSSEITDRLLTTGSDRRQLIWRVVCQGGRHEFPAFRWSEKGGIVVGWVGGGPVAVRDAGHADMRGSGWPQDRGSSWGAAV